MTRAADRAPFATGPVLVVAGAVAALLVATSARYGYHRDELYFLEAGRRLAWGYPDQPPLTPVLARLADELAPGSLVALRLSSVLVAIGVVVLTALLARELGGGRFAQGLAALAVGTGVLVLVLGHLLSTASVDLLVWVAVTWLVVRVMRTGDDRLWLAVGAVVGVGLLNKHLPLFLVAALAAGALLTPAARHHLRSPWLWGGAALALALWAPNVVWQWLNGWPQLELARDIRDEYGVVEERLFYVLLQVVLLSPVAALLAVRGGVRLWQDPAAPWGRVLVWAWAVLFVLFAVTAGKGYYLGGVYPALVAAGAVGVEARDRRPRQRAGWLAGAVLAAVIGAPIGLPLLPAATFAATPYAAAGEDQLETVGWPALVDAVEQAVEQVPTAARDDTVVFTRNYGEAGAVAELGRGRGLPPVYSGHNGFGDWGPPPPDAGPVVLVSTEPGLAERFIRCELVARVDNGEDVDNEEQGARIHLCDGPRGGWERAWPDLRHLDA